MRYTLVDLDIEEVGDIVSLFKPVNMKSPIVGLLVKTNDEGWLFRGGKKDEGGLTYIRFPLVLNGEVDLVMFIKYWESVNTSFS